MDYITVLRLLNTVAITIEMIFRLFVNKHTKEISNCLHITHKIKNVIFIFKKSGRILADDKLWCLI